MTAAEYSSHIRCYRMNQMLAQLAELLHASEGTFQYREGALTPQDACHKIVFSDANACAVVSANCAQKELWRFLASRTLDEVIRNIQSNRSDGRFYNYSHSIWHAPKTLADSIYDRICQRIFLDGESLFGFRFQDVTDISEMTYEGDPAYGSLFFLPYGATASTVGGIKFESGPKHEGILFQHSRLKYIRKLLAGAEDASSQGLAFLQKRSGETYRCIGYALDKDVHQFPVRARINGNGKWMLSLAGQDVVQIKDSHVRFPRNPIEESREVLKDELQICSKSEQIANSLPCFEQYKRFLETLGRQRHGTSAIFLDLQNSTAAKWMDNLEAHCRAQRVEPWSVLDLDDDRAGAVGGISRIDGCFIVDYVKGTLEFVNVIVDGQAVVDGSLASGSRRNSIPGFLANLVKECPDIKAVAFLFSEDGDLTVVRGSELKRQLYPQAS